MYISANLLQPLTSLRLRSERTANQLPQRNDETGKSVKRSRVLIRSLVLVLLALMLLAPCSNAQETKLYPPNIGSSSISFGSSVAYIDNWALVGTSGLNSSYLFHNVGGVWQPPVVLDKRTLGASQGGMVALNDVGWDAVSGAPFGYHGTRGFFGEVYIYDQTGDTTRVIDNSWVSGASDAFGADADISGNWMMVGDFVYNSYKGGVMFFSRGAGTNHWTHRVTAIHPDAEANNGFGESLAIQGNYAIAGSPYVTDTCPPGISRNGTVRVYHKDRDGLNSWGPIADLCHGDPGTNDSFGRSVAMHDNLVIVGAPGKNGKAGAAYIFQRSAADSTIWTQIKKLTASDETANDAFGSAVAIFPPYAVVAAYTDTVTGLAGAGSAYVFHRNEGGVDNWGQRTKIVSSDPAYLKVFGTSVSMDSNYALIGAPNDIDSCPPANPSCNHGAAYLFGRQTLDNEITAAGAGIIQGDSTVDFGSDTAVDIAFAGVTDTGRVTIECFNQPPGDVGSVPEDTVYDFHFVVFADSNLAFTTATIRIKISEIPPPGFGSPESVRIYSRSTYGSGALTLVPTVYDAGAGEIVATITGFSEFVAAGESLLPVELTSFAAISDGRDVLLTWETASEDNNAGFEVQSRPGDRQWSTIAFVQGLGNSRSRVTYRHTAKDVEPGIWSFRLKQIDFDGGFEFSPEVEVAVEIPDGLYLSPSYPNPVNTTATVRFVSAVTQGVMLELFDVIGRKVQTLYDGPADAGRMWSVTLDGSSIPAGLYILNLSGDRGSTTAREVVVGH